MIAALEEKQEALRELCRKYHVQEFYAFGSAVEGGFEEGRSDYDFLVRFLPAEPFEHADRYWGLLQDLEGLFGSPVDLVEINCVTNSYMQKAIEETKVALYAA
ncbi:MAG: nucleotidyltransferase domain-containing protein [Candidatus Hydrogenedentes bacterium]|nr:nucleotidyltransferase domain-containing protein [Candidatus Hydrogenedentota bacterium]